MDINAASLAAVNTAFNTAFNERLTDTETTWQRIAMRVASTSRHQSYPKLSEIGGMREWVGERFVQRLERDGFTVTNRRFENTIAVAADEIHDDNYGIYTPMVQDFAQTAAELPDDLVWEKLETGFASEHYDGQFFFDTDHPVEGEAGGVTSVSNFGGGSGAAWYLIDTTRAIKPMIFQDRQAPQITPKTNLTDDNVFNNDEFVWGVKRRCAAAFGAWQLVFASRQPLNAASYEAARVAMMSMRGHKGRKLNVKPKLLVVPPVYDGAARDLLVSERTSAGATNKWRGTAELHVETRLSN